LKKIGLKLRRTGIKPGKALDDDKQQQAQQEFHENRRQPLLDEAKSGKRTVLFVDAVNEVMGAYLSWIWCFVRVLLPSRCELKRYNVLGAFDPITHFVLTLTNDTSVKRIVFGEFLDKIFQKYSGAGQPITLILDNARYQKCQLV